MGFCVRTQRGREYSGYARNNMESNLIVLNSVEKFESKQSWKKETPHFMKSDSSVMHCHNKELKQHMESVITIASYKEERLSP